jgi:hypothetical protein
VEEEEVTVAMPAPRMLCERRTKVPLLKLACEGVGDNKLADGADFRQRRFVKL